MRMVRIVYDELIILIPTRGGMSGACVWAGLTGLRGLAP